MIDTEFLFPTITPDSTPEEVALAEAEADRIVTAHNAKYGIDEADNALDDAVENGGPGSGNFGHAGRPGAIGGSGSGGGGSSHVKGSVLHGMVKSAKANGGMTTNVAGNSPSEGIAFAPRKDTETIIDGKNFDDKALGSFVDKHWDTLKQDGMHVGGWYNTDDGKWYLDISKVGPYNKSVIAEAQKAEQLAVFDLKTFNEVKTGDIKNGKYVKSGEPETIFAEAFGGGKQGGIQNSASQSTEEDSDEDERVLNAGGGNPNHDPKTGRFATGVGGGSGGASGFKRAKESSSDMKARIRKEADAMVESMRPDDAYLGAKIKGIAKDLNIQAVKGPIKKPERMVPKAIEELGGNVREMKDVVRATAIIQRKEDRQAAIDRISKDFEIARVKDLNASGYSDTKVNIVLPSSKLVGEIILITPEMLNAKMKPTLYPQSGHDLYDVIRDTGQSASAIQDASTKSEKIYAAADAKYEARVAKGDRMELDYLVDR